jgi:O-acetylhomoserine (thiol)-lyase
MSSVLFDPTALATSDLAAPHGPGAIHRARASLIHLLGRRTVARLPDVDRRRAVRSYWESYFRELDLGNHPLERQLTRLDHGLGSLVFRPGYRALSGAILTLTHPGQNILASRRLSLKNLALLGHGLKKVGIEVRFFDPDAPADITHLADERTRAVFVESSPNPTLGIPELSQVSNYAHNVGVPLIVDNTLLTPTRLAPIEHGADIVVYTRLNFLFPGRAEDSASNDGKEGAVVDSGRFDWTREPQRWPEFTAPAAGFHDVVFAEAFEHIGNLTYLAHLKTHWH